MAFSVLVVDESPDERGLLCALVAIAAPGARIVGAGNGFDALIEVGQGMAELIVTDGTLPRMDGVKMIRHLIAQRRGRPPAIVAVSGHAPAHIERLGGLPASVALLAKPVEPALFVAAVNLALDAS